MARPHRFCVHGARPRWPHRSLPVVRSPVATTSTFSSYGLGPNVTIRYHCAAAVPFATTATSRATAVFLCYHRYFKSYRGLSLLPPLLQKLPRFSLLPPLIQEPPRFPLLPLLLQGLPGFFSATKGVIPYVTSPFSPSPTTSGLEARLCVAGLLTIWEAAHLHPTVAFGRKRAALPHLTLT